MKKTALITGITGQDGAYLAEFLLAKGRALMPTLFEEEITAGTVITHGGAVVQAATKKLLEPAAPAAAPAAGGAA